MIALASLFLLASATATPDQSPVPGIDSTTHTAREAVQLARGRIVSQVTSAANPKQRYAVYLPSNYRTDRTWPLLILLDPRGRALLPMEEAWDVADRLGYMVISSYGSRSDVPSAVDPNAEALNAIISDAEDLLALDRHRLYLAGFSGTARLSWMFGYQLRGYVAGVLGFGAGFPGDFELTHRPDSEKPPLVFFGGAGTRDFNFDELRRVDSTLNDVNLPHRIAWYEGPHRWAPTEIMVEGLEWMELQAMRFGLRSVDSAYVMANYQRDLKRAEFDRPAEPYRAYLRYRSIVADYKGLRETAEAAAAVNEMKGMAVIRQTTRQLARIGAWQKAYTDRLGEFLGDFRKADPNAPLHKALDRLQIADLMKRAADSTDLLEALSAQRALSHVMIYTSFYEPDDYMRANDPARALAILGIAAAVRPNDPGICYSRAKALTLLKRPAEAIDALDCITRATWASAERLETDPELAALRSEPGFKALLARLRMRAPADSVM